MQHIIFVNKVTITFINIMIRNRNIDFKNLIKELRTTNNLTQKQMSDMLHVSRQCISHWEIGTRIPDIFMLVKISKMFNIDILVLIDSIVES